MNKYEIYVDKTELFNYIESNNIKNQNKFEEIVSDFCYVYPDGGYVNFFSKEYNCIDGVGEGSIQEHLSGKGVKVTPEEFLIAIGYLPQKPSVSSSNVSPIKAEDIHYICELHADDRLYVERDGIENVLIKIGNYDSGYIESVRLSPEGLIELGSDLVRLGVALRDGTYQE